MRKITMRYTAAICGALFVLMGAVSIVEAQTAYGTNPGGKYVYRGGAKFGSNPGGKYVYRGGNAKFHTNPGGKYRWYGNLSQKPNRYGGRSGYSSW